jgi:hypothetical protein
MARNWLAGLLACFCLIALSIRLIDTPAQAETPSESACFSAVQGKVAWS